LVQHSGLVSSIDWNPETNKIATCGHDRNAYVWELRGDTWKPTLVVLRINRAATKIKWSPAGNKLAVASGAKTVAICQYEESNDWWVSKKIKKHKSTVLDLAWCINNKFIVTGSVDFKCRIFSAYIENVDDDRDDGFGEVWPNQHQFGEVLAEFDQARAWVNSVAWSPSGLRIAFVGQGSTLHIVSIVAGSEPDVVTVKHKDLPFLTVDFLSDDTILACGFDRNPTIFTSNGKQTGAQWSLEQKVDKETSAVSVSKSSNVSSAFAKFRSAADRGHQNETNNDVTSYKTRHKNAIDCVSLVMTDPNRVTRFVTSSTDGQVLFWNVSY